jgi:zinc protease
MPDVRRTRFQNGLTLLSVRRERSDVAAVLTLYRAGLLHEPPGLCGVAHLTEHMLFRGTESRPQGWIDTMTGRLGGVNNAVTTSDYTAYYFVLPAEHWRVPLEIESDRMRGCSFEKGAFETERRIAIEERSMLSDDPDAVLDEAASSLAFTVHPYGRPVAGRREDLERMSLDDVRAFYDAHYVPGKAVLVAAGGIDHDAVLEAVRTLFGPVAAAGTPPPPVPQEPEQRGPRRRVVELPGVSRQCMVSYHCPRADHEDSPALEVLTALLSSGRSSRLYRRFVADGGATEVSAVRHLEEDPGLFQMSASVLPDVDEAAFEAELSASIADIAADPPDDREVEKAIALISVDLALNRETALGLAGGISFWESLGGWEKGTAFDEAVGAVRGSDLARVAGRYLTPDRRNVVWLRPRAA